MDNLTRLEKMLNDYSGVLDQKRTGSPLRKSTGKRTPAEIIRGLEREFPCRGGIRKSKSAASLGNAHAVLDSIAGGPLNRATSKVSALKKSVNERSKMENIAI